MIRKFTIGSFALIGIIILTSAQDSHNHDDHGHNHSHSTNKQLTNIPSDACRIGKETQFLLELRTALIKPVHFSHIATLNGQVRSTTAGNAIITTPYSARIEKIYVGIGQRVKRGQNLAVLRQTISAAEQLEISSRLQEISADLRTKEAELARLRKLEDVIEKKRITNLEIEIEKLVALKAQFSGINSSGQKTTVLTAPISGKLNDFHITELSEVPAGKELFSIYNSDQILVEATLYDHFLLAEDDSLIFSVSNPDANHPVLKGVQLVSISPSLDPQTQTGKMILRADNTENHLRPGQFVEVGVSKYSAESTIHVSNSAIASIEGRPVVFTHTSPEQFNAVFVKTGASNGVTTEIKTGISAGDRVVVSGTESVKSIYLSK